MDTETENLQPHTGDKVNGFVGISANELLHICVAEKISVNLAKNLQPFKNGQHTYLYRTVFL